MSTIGKAELLQQVISSLRIARETARPTDVRTPTATAARAGAQRRERGPSAAAGREALAGAVRRRLREIDRDDPQRARRALRAVIEAALQSRWGAAMAGDPEFHALVDEVLRQIESEPELRPLVDAALGPLLSSDH